MAEVEKNLSDADKKKLEDAAKASEVKNDPVDRKQTVDIDGANLADVNPDDVEKRPETSVFDKTVEERTPEENAQFPIAQNVRDLKAELPEDQFYGYSAVRPLDRVEPISVFSHEVPTVPDSDQLQDLSLSIDEQIERLKNKKKNA